MDSRNLGITLGSRKKDDKDNGEETHNVDWSMIFMLLKNRGFSHKEILQLSYPQLNAYMNNINNELTYNIVIPYLGGKSDKKESKEEGKIESKEELMSLISSMNSDFM